MSPGELCTIKPNSMAWPDWNSYDERRTLLFIDSEPVVFLKTYVRDFENTFSALTSRGVVEFLASRLVTLGNR
jgi:hypothetical protein